MYRAIALIAFIITIVFLPGCATAPHLEAPHVTIERIDSASAKITDAQVEIIKNHAVVRVELRSLQVAHSTTPSGNVDVKVIAPDTSLLYETSTTYHRQGKKSGLLKAFWVSVDIPVIPPEGSVIRITHRDAL